MAKIEEIDLVLGNNEKNNIVSIAEEYYNGKNKTKAQVTDIDKQKEFVGILKDFNENEITLEKDKKQIKISRKDISVIKTVYNWEIMKEE